MSPLPVASSSDSRISSFGDRELVPLLTKYFGYSTFRGNQLEAITAVLSGFVKLELSGRYLWMCLD